MQMVSKYPSPSQAALWLRGSPSLQLAALAFAYVLCAWFAAADAAADAALAGSVNSARPALLLWLPNAVVLSAMLLRSVQNWWKYSLTQFVCDALLQTAGSALPIALGLAFINCLEVLLCAVLLRRLGGRRFACTSGSELLLFASVAMLLVPTLTATLSCALQSPWGAGELPLRPWLSLFLGHGMGMALLTPLLLGWLRRPADALPVGGLERMRAHWPERCALATLLVLVLSGQGRGLLALLDAQPSLAPLQHYLMGLVLSSLPVLALLNVLVQGRAQVQRCAQRLRAAQAELTALNRDLERRVSQRTAELERLATTDSLTDTHNRRFLMARAQIEIAQAIRNAYAVSLVMFDIDHFKHVNDSHGHNVGDRVLVALCQAVKQDMRLGDTFARIGGEEFVMLLPHSDAEQAWLVAQRLRAMLEGLEIKASRGQVLHITASFGVASLSARNNTVEALYTAADAALYRAKAAGRNCVVADRPSSYSS